MATTFERLPPDRFILIYRSLPGWTAPYATDGWQHDASVDSSPARFPMRAKAKQRARSMLTCYEVAVARPVAPLRPIDGVTFYGRKPMPPGAVRLPQRSFVAPTRV